TTLLPPDTTSVCAQYQGDAIYDLSQTSMPWTMSPDPLTPTLTSDAPANGLNTGQSVNFTGAVTGVPGGETPTGTIPFRHAVKGGNPSNMAAPVNLDANGKAALKTSFNVGGQHSVTAVYTPPDTKFPPPAYASGTSAPLALAVTAVPNISSLSLVQ